MAEYVPTDLFSCPDADLAILIQSRTWPDPVTGCWLWQWCLNCNGYGEFRYRSRHWLAHRAAYEAFVGPIPGGLHVLHRCDVRACCNPAHLFIGTNQDNIADSVAKGRRKGITRRRPRGLIYRPQIPEAVRAAIRRDAPNMSCAACARKYGVDRSSVKKIVEEVPR